VQQKEEEDDETVPPIWDAAAADATLPEDYDEDAALA